MQFLSLGKCENIVYSEKIRKVAHLQERINEAVSRKYMVVCAVEGSAALSSTALTGCHRTSADY